MSPVPLEDAVLLWVSPPSSPPEDAVPWGWGTRTAAEPKGCSPGCSPGTRRRRKAAAPSWALTFGADAAEIRDLHEHLGEHVGLVGSPLPHVDLQRLQQRLLQFVHFVGLLQVLAVWRGRGGHGGYRGAAHILSSPLIPNMGTAWTQLPIAGPEVGTGVAVPWQRALFGIVVVSRLGRTVGRTPGSGLQPRVC